MKKQFGNLTVALLILGATISAAHADPVRGRATKCIQGMNLPKAILAAQSPPVPRLLEGGNEILPGTAGSPMTQLTPRNGHVSEVGHRIRMRFRMSDVKPTESNKFIDFTTICRAWTEQNVDYVEECSLDPASNPKVGITAYQTRTELRDGKVDGCRPGMSVAIEYAVAVDPKFMDLVGGSYLLLMTTDQVNAKLKTSIDALFDNWVSGFKP